MQLTWWNGWVQVSVVEFSDHLKPDKPRRTCCNAP